MDRLPPETRAYLRWERVEPARLAPAARARPPRPPMLGAIRARWRARRRAT